MEPDVKIEKRLRERLDEEPLLTLRLDVINKCNLRCVMCHYSDPIVAKKPAQSISAEQFAEYFSQVSPYVKDIMLSCGDEPLMSKHFVEILDVIAAEPVPRDVGFCTNAMLMTSRIRNAMISKGATYVLLSMDGATKSTMERIRVGSSYDRVVGNIKALRDLRASTGARFPLMVLDFVMMRSNIHEGPIYVKMAKELGVGLLDFRHAVPSSYWDDIPEKMESHPKVFNYYRRRIVEEAAAVGIDVVIPDAFGDGGEEDCSAEEATATLDDFYAVQSDAAGSEVPTPKTFPDTFVTRKAINFSNEFFGKTYCERPFSEVFIRNQKEVLPCAWHGKVMGRLDEGESISDIFWGEGFAKLRATMLQDEVDPGCRNCPIKQDMLPLSKKE